jgi:hypothetical protein
LGPRFNATLGFTYRLNQDKLRQTRRREGRYQSVEPENRLVARTLEQRWDESLRQERQLREEYDRFLATTPASLSDTDAQRIQAASQNISALWHAPDTTAQDRKAIVRCLVHHVVGSNPRTRRKVSLPGIPLGNARCLRSHASFSLAHCAIAVGPSAFATTAQMVITITSPNR